VTLACGPRKERDVAQEFDGWIRSADGVVALGELRRRALDLRRAGWRHFSVDALWHSMRFDAAVKVGPDADGRKLNDRYTSRLARLLMEREPELQGFFETRKLRG